MNKILFSICFICILSSACINSTKKKEKHNSTAHINPDNPVETVIYPSESDTIKVETVGGTAVLKVHKEKMQRIMIEFNSLDYNQLSGRLSSRDSTANLRFTQIILPDGNMDGPFGWDINYELAVKGNYILIINENQMAGDPWSGDFEASILLSK